MKKIGLLCPSDTELAPFLPCIEGRSRSQTAMLEVWEGKLCGFPVAALFSGVCKVNAAVAAQILISHYQSDAVILAGVAGGLDESVRVLDTVIPEQCAYHDVSQDILTEFHPWMPSIWFRADPQLLDAARRAGQKAGFPVKFGSLVTGGQFIADEERKRLREEFSPLAVDMETAAAAHVCYVNQIPFLAVRTITDTEQEDGQENFELNCEQASARAKDLTLLLLDELKKSLPEGSF